MNNKEEQLKRLIKITDDKINIIEIFLNFKITYFLNNKHTENIELHNYNLLLKSDYTNNKYFFNFEILNKVDNSKILSGKFNNIKELLQIITKLNKSKNKMIELYYNKKNKG